MAPKIERPSLIVSTPRTRRAYDMGVRQAEVGSKYSEAFARWRFRVEAHKDFTEDESSAFTAGYKDTKATPALGSQYNPFRLAKTPEEYTAIRMSDAPYIGVSGSQFAGEEATVVLSIGNEWHHMDVEYAKQVVRMLAEAIIGAGKHNKKLEKNA